MKCLGNGLHANAIEITPRHTAGTIQGEWCRSQLGLSKDPAKLVLFLGEIIQHHLHNLPSLLQSGTIRGYRSPLHVLSLES